MYFQNPFYFNANPDIRYMTEIPRKKEVTLRN